ncbi:MAG: hypothetical protein ACTTJN_05675 [Prevotella intermedia]
MPFVPLFCLLSASWLPICNLPAASQLKGANSVFLILFLGENKTIML